MPDLSHSPIRRWVIPVALAAAGCLQLAASPLVSAPHDASCSLKPGTPRIVAGQASFIVRAHCPPDAERRVVQIQLVGNDAAYDDVLRWTQEHVGGRVSDLHVSRRWMCEEDAVRHDEVYVRARFTDRAHGAPRAEAWINSATARGHCR